MSYQSEHQKKFKALELYLSNIEELRRNANGGNCVLFSYDPSEETLYIEEAKRIYNTTAKFIDLSNIMQKFIDIDGWEDFASYYNDFKDTPYKVFKDESSQYDYFSMIIDEIKAVSSENKIPIIIRTGALYGTGIDNQNIMENKSVMALKKPLVIFYPSIQKNNKVLFLGIKEASKYRCQVI